MNRLIKSIGKYAKKFLCIRSPSDDSSMKDARTTQREVGYEDDGGRNQIPMRVSAEVRSQHGNAGSQTTGQRALDKDTFVRETSPSIDSRMNQNDTGAAHLRVPDMSLLDESLQNRGTSTTASERSKSPSALPSGPRENDLRYIMKLSQPQSVDIESTRQLVAAVGTSSHYRAESNGAAIESHLPDAMAEEQRADGTFRYIFIRYDGDPEGKRAETQCIMHDTGSGCSLTFASKLVALGMDWESLEFSPGCLESISGEAFSPIGCRRIKFSYHNRIETTHWTDILVLADPPEGQEPQFDFLFGRDTIRRTKAIKWDRNVIGHVRIQPSALQILTEKFPSLLVHTPPQSISGQGQTQEKESIPLPRGMSG